MTTSYDKNGSENNRNKEEGAKGEGQGVRDEKELFIDDLSYYTDGAVLLGLQPQWTAATLEAAGWREWITTLMPFIVTAEFSDAHVKFWDTFWGVLQKIRKQKEIKLRKYNTKRIRIAYEEEGCIINSEERVILLILARGLAKSSTIEMAAVMRACIAEDSYCLYVCESQDQANEHIGNIRSLIEHEGSRIGEFYPKMSLTRTQTTRGKKTVDKADMFITNGGVVFRGKGLDANVRGIKIVDRRVDLLCLDDIDSVTDSIAVSNRKLKQIAASILPTQASSQNHPMVLGGQNLILKDGVFNQIYTGKTDVLAMRTIIGVQNAFTNFREGIEYESRYDEKEDRVKHFILPAAIPTWSGLDVQAAQEKLHESGLFIFLAEYQNSFEHLQGDRVFWEWNEERHVITRSMFHSIFGSYTIPPHWHAKATGDIGFSKESHSAWLFTAVSAQNSPFPNLYFAYRSKTFIEQSIDDQAVALWAEMFPNTILGKNHFETVQAFNHYPDLVRALRIKFPHTAHILDHFRYDQRKNAFTRVQYPGLGNSSHSLSDPDHPLAYVRQAALTYRSQIRSWTISHEKSGEQRTLAQKYGLPIQKTKHFSAEAGVAEANHLLHGDMTLPHPFKPDAIDPNTGFYRLGRPHFYVIVADDELTSPQSDEGFKDFRTEVAGQPFTPETLTERGLKRRIPLKYRSDHPDAFRMFAADYAIPQPAPLTEQELVQSRIPAHLLSNPINPNDPKNLANAAAHLSTNAVKSSIEHQMSLEAATRYAKSVIEYEQNLDQDPLSNNEPFF